MKIIFDEVAFKDFSEWAEIDPKIHKRISVLILDVIRHPFMGLGKPEPLKHELRGYWSRRIDETHRLVYRVEDDALLIIACKHHY